MTDDEFWLEALKEYLYEPSHRGGVNLKYKGSCRYVALYWITTLVGEAMVPMWYIGPNKSQVPPQAAKELLLSKQPTFDIEMFKLGKELTHG